ncbi:hypothetical protein FisN_31Hu011 [Fistulifera solaris]|uniref:Reverse transcriptase domain-containing protein n=1 Tax=Fistulifera solaris TaxID=1519565 RepID=A0A1Z5JWH2_FISSO|nr:hypothetical protein FisN_31Hu011 [Fistulifera solaris]|eukprot:GAX18236.1 hypothetical protein FisN_31Hu011 [Fistulifera solaris]
MFDAKNNHRPKEQLPAGAREGVAQGDPLSMILYGLTLTPIAEKIRENVKNIVQPFYADDVALAGKSSDISKAMEILMRYGPARGYFPEPSKSVVVCRQSDEEKCSKILSKYEFKYVCGHRYLGGFIGSAAARDEYVKEKIENWTRTVNLLAEVAKKYPQSAYSGFRHSLQMEWQYIQRVIPRIAPLFEPLESAIQNNFLPALLGQKEPVTGELRKILALGTKAAGIGIWNPMETCCHNFSTSEKVTKLISGSLLENLNLNVRQHQERAKTERAAASASRHASELQILKVICAAKGKTKKANKKSDDSCKQNRHEFGFPLRIRTGLPIQALPQKCDGCNKPFSVEHAQTCKHGGLVILRHDDVKNEFMSLCAQAYGPKAVRNEPTIHTYSTDNRNAQKEQELRGDISIYGFWSDRKTTIFDVRVTDTDAPSHKNRDPMNVLASQELEKRRLYGQPCMDRRRDFTPLVFSVDGLMGKQAVAASRQLARKLQKKWKRPYSEIGGFIRSRLSLSLV